MPRRSYQQFCGFAVALDLLAERWTFLVVRELLPGGRRFGDLFDSLPGVSTNLLTSRLRTLEEAGVVRRREITHPAPVSLYELTDRGEELRPIISQLGLWGVPLLPNPTATDFQIEPRWLLGAMAMSYQSGLPDGAIEFVIDGAELTITISGENAILSYGPPSIPPMLSVRLSSEAFGALALTQGQATADVEMTGQTELLPTLFENLPLDDVQRNVTE